MTVSRGGWSSRMIGRGARVAFAIANGTLGCERLRSPAVAVISSHERSCVRRCSRSLRRSRRSALAGGTGRP
jgi:hypothetical protein